MDSPLPFERPHPFTQHYRVEPDDIDGLGHTNNQVYVRWCQDTAWAHSQTLGVTLSDYQTLQRAMAIRSARYEYLQASYLGDPICVATWITHSDRRLNLSRRFQIFNRSSGALLCRAELEFVCINLSNGKPCRMPPLFVERYAEAATPD